MIEVNIKYPETRFYLNHPDYCRYATFPNEYEIEIIEGFYRRIVLNGLDDSENVKTIYKKDIEENLSKILSVKDDYDFTTTVFNISGIQFKCSIYELYLL